MITIPKFLYDKRIYNYLVELADFHLEDFHKIKELDKDNLVIRIIEVLGTDAYQVIIGAEDFDKTLKYFSRYLKSGNHHDAYDLVNELRKNSFEFYEPYLEELFNEILAERRAA